MSTSVNLRSAVNVGEPAPAETDGQTTQRLQLCTEGKSSSSRSSTAAKIDIPNGLEAAGAGGAAAGARVPQIELYSVDAPVQRPLFSEAPCSEGFEAEDDRLKR